MTLLSKISARIRSYRKISPSVVELHKAVHKFLPKNPIVLEAGAHAGYDTVGISKIWPKGFIHGFEPVPTLYKSLTERTKKQHNVKTYNIALGDKDNVDVTMFVSSGQSSGSSSILPPSKHLHLFPDVAFNDKVVVPMKTIKTWAIEEGVDAIDLMWLDMQGYEINALKGAGDLLKVVKVIYTELCTDELYQGMITKESYIKFLNERGFDLVSVSEERDMISEGIFVNREILKRR